MNILVPMAGEGSRFAREGYAISKPLIPTYDKRSGNALPMVVCAVLDLPGVVKDGSNVVFVDRAFHKADGAEAEIRKYFPRASFITVDRLTEGQASTCLLAKGLIDSGEELLIAGCDNGMEFDADKFNALKKTADVLVFTCRNNPSALINPDAYGWMIVDSDENIIGTSIKKAISEDPLKDHAVVATFWFKTGKIFVAAAEKMIAENDRINNEFYVDQAIKHVLELDYKAKVFEIERYIGWGVPADYELYQRSFEYWCGFYEREKKFF